MVRLAYSVKRCPPQPRIWGCHGDPLLLVLAFKKGCGCEPYLPLPWTRARDAGRGGGRGGGAPTRPSPAQVKNAGKHVVHLLLALNSTSYITFSLGLFLLYLGCCETWTKPHFISGKESEGGSGSKSGFDTPPKGNNAKYYLTVQWISFQEWGVGSDPDSNPDPISHK